MGDQKHYNHPNSCIDTGKPHTGTEDLSCRHVPGAAVIHLQKMQKMLHIILQAIQAEKQYHCSDIIPIQVHLGCQFEGSAKTLQHFIPQADLSLIMAKRHGCH